MKKEVDFDLKMAILGVKMPWLGILKDGEGQQVLHSFQVRLGGRRD